MKPPRILFTLLIVSIFLSTQIEGGKQFWFDVFRTFSDDHNINCTNQIVVETAQTALTENEIEDPNITAITTMVDKNRYKKCTGLLTGRGKNLLGEFINMKNVPIEYEVQVTDDGKNFTVLVRQR
jgi:hypothetical protein